ncbi:MAG: flagellar biosynthesis protein FlgJ [Opitutaceae bacterium]|jgi:flagellar protein FlgJ
MSIDPVSALSSSTGSAPMTADDTTAHRPTPAELTRASQQFEAIMIRQLLAPAIEPMMNGGSLGGGSDSGSGGGVYGYMLTDVLATSISQGGGLGLSGVISKQLSPAVTAADPS